MKKDRRDFLHMGAGFFAFNPVDFLARNLCSLSESFCDESEGVENYLLFHLAGAPPRWLFDSPLQPRKSDKRVANPMIVTTFSEKEFNSSRDVEFEYRSTQVGKYLMPHLWSLPTSSSVTYQGQLSKLLDHALIIRGTRMGVDGHSINGRRLVAPNPNGPSITGLLADRSKKDLPAVGMTGSQYPVHVTSLGAFRSQKANSLILISKKSPDYFQELFHSFLEGAKGSQAEEELVEAILSRRDILRPQTVKARSQVKGLLKKDLEKLKAQYKKRFAKYEKIILESKLRRDLKGLTDKAIPGFEKERLTHSDQDNASFFLLDDYFLGDRDLRDALLSMELQGLAQQMALTEFLVVNGLSQTITIDLANPTKLNLDSGYHLDDFDIKKKSFHHKTRQVKIKEGKPKTFTFDSHGSGLIAHHLFSGIFYYTFANCLIEMTETFKEAKDKGGKNLYQKTLIHLASEFGREPRPDLMGSEHGFNGQLNTFLSGAIRDFKIIGNIFDTNKGTPATYYDIGTWGEGAPLDFFKRPLVYGNIASSICAMLGIPSPTPKDPPLVKVAQGQIETLTEECENVIA